MKCLIHNKPDLACFVCNRARQYVAWLDQVMELGRKDHWQMNGENPGWKKRFESGLTPAEAFAEFLECLRKQTDFEA